MPTGATNDDEVDAQLRRLLAPSGDAAYRHARGEALQWLLAHADESYPKLRAIVDVPAPPVLAISALAQFQRADSVPLLRRILHEADDATTVVAASALAEVHAPEALAALEQALGDRRDQVVASAADALAQRQDRAACSSLVGATAHPNAEVRARVQSAIDRLGCPARGVNRAALATRSPREDRVVAARPRAARREFRPPRDAQVTQIGDRAASHSFSLTARWHEDRRLCERPKRAVLP